MKHRIWTILVPAMVATLCCGCEYSSADAASSLAGPAATNGQYQPGVSPSTAPTVAPAPPTTTTPNSPSSTSSYYSPTGSTALPTGTLPAATNPFVLTSVDPLSTFAADVDTASYDVTRRALLLGKLPNSSEVRLEEFVNYFRYDYPAPTVDAVDAFDVTLATAPNPLGQGTTILRVAIQGRDAVATTSAQTANLVFLVDVSGSMAAGNKLPLAQSVLRQSLDLLSPADKISIVTYASGTSVPLKPTPLSERIRIEQAIVQLTASGSTAGAAGLTLAYAQAEAALVSGGVNHVILCTDGDFNVGPSSTPELVDLIRTKRKSGIGLTVLGFGDDNLNDSMMAALSNAGNGIYAVLTDPDQATRYVSERLLATIRRIATDLKIQITFNPSEVYAYRLLGYEDRALTDAQFANDAVDAGEIGARHRVTALYELVRRGQEIPSVANAPAIRSGASFSGSAEIPAELLAQVRLRYRDAQLTSDPSTRELTRGIPIEAPSINPATDPDFAWAVGVAAAAEVFKSSPYATQGSLADLEALLAQASISKDPDRAEFVELFRIARGLLGR